MLVRRAVAALLAVSVTVAGAAPAPSVDVVIERIAVGSCLNQTKPAPILSTVAKAKPNLVVLMGDNVYHDGTPAGLHDAYATLGTHPDFVKLLEAAPLLLAVWDDHDYGDDDAGAENPHKVEAKRELLAFFGTALDAERRDRDGVYVARTFGPPGRRVQVILLDTRWFKSAPTVSLTGKRTPNEDPAATMLGEAQWTWLAETLRQPADVRVLVSSTQVIPTEHRWEKWSDFPRERARLLRTIGESGASGVVLVSGDRHRGELSMLEDPAVGYPLWELTSSSLNVPIPGSEANRFRRGKVVEVANVGFLEIEWGAPEPRVVLSLRDPAGRVQLEEAVPLASLRARAAALAAPPPPAVTSPE
jgi:alkaline phosphatase D